MATFLINSMLALILVENRAIAGASDAASVGSYVWQAKIALAVVATGAFLGSFYAAHKLEAWQMPMWVLRLVQAVLFAAAGAAVGHVLIMLRKWLGDQSPLLWHLIWMHALGVAGAYVIGVLATIPPKRLLKSMPAAIGFRD